MTDSADDDALFRVYNRALMALSAAAEKPKRLPAPDIAAHAVSPICGSEVTVEFSLKDNRVVEVGFETQGCALLRSVTAVLAKAAPGKTAAEIAAAGEQLRAMLEDNAPPPAGDWADLNVLEPVRDYKARHNAVLLPFEAAGKAFKKI